MAKGKGKGKGGYRRRKMAIRRRLRRRTNVPEWASLSETVDFGSLNVGTSYSLNNINLAQFPRASAVAQGYQFFRIKKVRFLLTPLLDTFPSTGNSVVPYLTWVINKTGSAFVGLNKDWYLQNGAKPIRFDDKTISISYAPAVLADLVEAGGPGINNQPNLPKIRQWLTTNADAFAAVFNPSTVSHTGHYQLISAEASAIAMTYRMTLTAEFEFKKPLSKLPQPGDPGYHTVEYPLANPTQ